MSNNKAQSDDWLEDLRASRDVTRAEKSGFEMVLGWYEKWRVARGAEPGRESAAVFWKAQVQAKRREPWQLEQWAEAVRWYLAWLGKCREAGGSGESLEERVRRAVDQAGARRGLALRTRRTYAGWAGRYARWVGGAREVMDPGKARDWLSWLVTEGKVSFATQSSGAR